MLAGMRVWRGHLWVELGNPARAEHCYRRAAEAGHVEGMWFYAQARYVARDHDSAEKWCRAAAEQGYLEAILMLAGVLKRRGDEAGAELWYREALRRGSATGRKELARLLTQRREREGHAGLLPGQSRTTGGYSAERLAFERGEYKATRSKPKGRKRLGDAVAEAWREGQDRIGPPY